MAHSDPNPASQKIFTLLLLVTAVAALYFAADVLMPLALAILLTFMLAPLVTRLERWRVGRVPAVLLTVSAVFMVLFGIGWIVGNQVVDLAADTPRYQRNLVARIQQFKRSETGPLSRLEKTITELSSEIAEPVKKQISAAKDVEKDALKDAATATDETAAGPEAAPVTPPPGTPDTGTAAATTPSGAPKPIPVEIVQPRFSPYSIMTGVLPGAFGWLATAGIVIVFLIFMLLEREDMRNRLIRLIGSDQITVTTQALDDAAHRVSKYLRMQLIINASYGLMLALGLYLIGLPNAITWGLFAGLLRYLPYVGPWLGAGIGMFLSLAFFPTWTEPALTLALFVAAELIVNNVLEPVLYQSSTGISTVGILAAALFWTWLWGPIGLVLATPLTVCMAVIGRYVPNLEFLNVLLTDQPALPPGPHLYQRLLVSDEESPRELVEEYLHNHTIDELFEHVLVPVLVLTEQDAHRGNLEPGRREYILDYIDDLLDELPEFAADKLLEPEMGPADKAVIILPAKDHADEIAAHMLRLSLAHQQIEARVLPNQMLFGEMLEEITRSPQPLVIVSAVPPLAIRHARAMTKRLRGRLQGVKIIVGVWTGEEHAKRTARLTSAGADRAIHHLHQALEFVERHVPRRPRPEDETATTSEETSPAAPSVVPRAARG